MYGRGMGKYDADIIRMYKAGSTQVAIVAELGCARSTVSTVLKDAGLTNPQAKEIYRPSSYIPDDIEILADHRRHQAYRSMVAMDKDSREISIGKATRERMEKFSRGLGKKAWTYDQATEDGFYTVPRKPEYGNRPFIRKEELLGLQEHN